MNRDDEQDEEALPAEPDEPEGVIVAGGLGGAIPGVAVEEALEGIDSPDSEEGTDAGEGTRSEREAPAD